MIINLLKIKEIVFVDYLLAHSYYHVWQEIERVVSAKLLGVTFCSNLKFDEHVKNILTICSQRCYLLKCLKAQGLPAKQLNLVFFLLLLCLVISMPCLPGVDFLVMI